MLHSHPNVFLMDEGWFFNERGCSVHEWLDEAAFDRWANTGHNGWLRAIPRDEALLLARRAMMETLMRTAASRALRNTPILRIGDKTTFSYTAHPERLHALFPRSRFIHVVRDGRDSAVSQAFYQFRYRKREGPGFFSMFSPDGAAHMERAYAYHAEGRGDPVPLFNEETLRYFAGIWAHCVDGARRAAALWGDRFHEVRYEDLRARPERIADTLRFLAVPATPEIVEHVVSRNRFEQATQGRKPGEALPTAHRRKGLVGDWRTHFTDHDRATFQSAAGPQLNQSGYTDW